MSMEVAGLRNYSVNWSVAIFLLLYIFAPNVYGGFYMVLFSIVLFSTTYLIFQAVKANQFNGILMVPDTLYFLIAIIILSVTITLTLNASFFTTIGLSDLAKPLVAMTFFVFGVISNQKYSMPEIKKTLVLVAKIIIIGQLIVIIDQVYDINAFSVLYDYEKTSSTGDIYSFKRSTGTLGNPNYLAWIILQCGATIYIFSRKKSRHLWIILVMLMILLSGSKSMIASFPLSILLVVWLKGDRRIITLKNTYMLFFIIILILVAYNLLLKYPEIFPRLMVLLDLLSGEDTSGGGRFAIWDDAYTYFLSKESFMSWAFGMGPIQEFKTLDNGYLYTLFRNGFIGLLLHLALHLYFIVKFYKFYDRELGGLGVQYVLLGSLSELQSEGLATWSALPQLFLYAGLAYSYEYRHQLAFKKSLVQ